MKSIHQVLSVFSVILFLTLFLLAEAQAAPAPGLRFVYSPNGGLITAEGAYSNALPHCGQFLDDQGNIGPYGEMVIRYIDAEMEPNGNSAYLQDDIPGFHATDSAPICPNWSKFDETMRKKFWVWTIASIAAVESDCLTTAKSTRDQYSKYVAGLLQLDSNPAAREDRGPHCRGIRATDLFDPEVNIDCGMDDLALSLRPGNIHRTNGRIYNPGFTNSQWHELRRPNGGKIGRLIRGFRPCTGMDAA